MEQFTILEAGMSAKDDEDMFAEITTWVPECKWYRKLPCACEHVAFHSATGAFLPGWDKFWHLPTLQRMLTRQVRRMAAADPHLASTSDTHFWYISEMGGFKNSLDVGFFILSSH